MEKKRSGFTLIEMLVVVAIIGLLSSIIVVGLGSSRAKARDARRISDVRQIETWAELGYRPTTGYPDGGTDDASLLPIPKDPQNCPYSYVRTSDFRTVYVGACVEDAANASNNSDCADAYLCGSARAPSCPSNKYCVKLSSQ